MTGDREELLARIHALEGALGEALERADRAEAALAATRAHARKAAPPAVRAKWIEHDSGHFTCAVGQARTAGERRLLDLPWPEGWLVVGGLAVSDTTRTREVDALVISPRGLAVIEQKDLRGAGTLWFAPNGPPLLDGVPVPHLEGALAQARLPAQMLAAVLREAGVAAGFIASVLCIGGAARPAQERVGGAHLATTRSLVGAVSGLWDADSEDHLRIGTIEALVVTLGLPQAGLPPLRDCGFASSH